MVDELLGVNRAASPFSAAFIQLHGHILAQTQGNPFFVSEMVKTLVEVGAVFKTAPTRVLPAGMFNLTNSTMSR